MKGMKHLSALAITLCLATPVVAEDDGDMKQGMDLLSEGAQLLFRGLLAEMEPAIRDLEGAIDNLNAYHAPEVLPNGDIIIRRKVPLKVEPPVEGEVDL